MNQEEKLEFIGEMLDKEKEPLPVSLEKENVVSMLKSVDVEKKKTAKIIPFKRYASIAAALIIVISAVMIGGKLSGFDKADDTQNSGGVTSPAFNQEVATTNQENDYSEIEEYFLTRHRELVEMTDNGYINSSASDNANTYFKVESVSDLMNSNEVSATPYGKTNTQVDGVDEGDIIKNDGKYIYIVSKSDKAIYIVDAASMKKVSEIRDFEGSKSKDNETSFVPQDIYVSGDTLTVISTESSLMSVAVNNGNVGDYFSIADCLYPSDVTTHIFFYDISDRTQPKKLASHTQSGDYGESRAVGSTLYTVSLYRVDLSYYVNENEIRSKCVPKINGRRIEADDIAISDADGNGDRSYVVISSFDMSGSAENSSSYAYLGWYGELYMTAERLYITETGNDELTDDASLKRFTKITKLSLSNGKIKFEAEGRVGDCIYDNYSMDEYNGYFRIVTTDFDRSNIYILNEKMETVGKLLDIAEDESVQSVRFMGDTAYVVTFENTDPLFVIDLSEPTAPVIKGKVELPGFSAYLHPVGDGYVVGVGYDGDNEGAEWNTVKVTLFDVKAPTSPKVADSLVIKNANTDVNYDSKAFIYYPEKQLIGIPTTRFSVSEDIKKYSCDYNVISVKDGKLKNQVTLHHSSGNEAYNSEFFRGTYISDTVYTMTDNSVCSFDINSGKLLEKLKLN